MAEIKATSFCDLVARTPTCQSFRQPGAFRALRIISSFSTDLIGRILPVQKGRRIVEPEHRLGVFDIVISEQFMNLR